jgi:DNA invertase Pin-like site-specific DNA recombinase
MEEKKRAYSYIRVSGKSQLTGHGFDRQEEIISAYAEKAGYEIIQTFREEAVSGTKGEVDRPAFQEMMSEILRNGVRIVIIEGLDRLAREYRIQETLLIYLASKGVTLISARTEEDVTESIQSDPMRKALVQIQGVFAELEKNLLVKKLRNAREKVRQQKGSCEGRKGYSDFKNPSYYEQLMKEIKKLRRKPKGQKRMPFTQVAEELNKQKWETPSGKIFTGQIVQNILRK